MQKVIIDAVISRMATMFVVLPFVSEDVRDRTDISTGNKLEVPIYQLLLELCWSEIKTLKPFFV